jgi:hypothetical protein
MALLSAALVPSQHMGAVIKPSATAAQRTRAEEFHAQTEADLVALIASHGTSADADSEPLDDANISTLIKGRIVSIEEYVAMFGPIDWEPFVELPGIDE